MTYTITSQCISCNRCLSACPTNAIQVDKDHCQINPGLCNNCVGFYGVPQCWAICPTSGACVPSITEAFRLAHSLNDPTEYWNRWFKVYNHLVFQLHKTRQDSYWENWFELYSQRLTRLMQSHGDKSLQKTVLV